MEQQKKIPLHYIIQKTSQKQHSVKNAALLDNCICVNVSLLLLVHTEHVNNGREQLDNAIY